MELDDLDLGSSWPLDQISFASSSFRFPSSDQPFSPLWSFSSADGGAGELCSAPTLLTDYSLLLSSKLSILSLDSNNATGYSPRKESNRSDLFFFFFLLLICSRSLHPFTGSESETATKDNHLLPSPSWGVQMPLENPDTYCAIKAKMTQALRFFKESTGQQHLLAQVWAPVKNRNGRYLLTTSGQPFFLGPNSNGLNQYRMVSLTYMFSLDSERDGELGLPGRVFRKKLPEWTPNVQYYSSKEFSRLGHALNYNVQGTLALPVFEPSRQLCVGVVELIMTSPKINYAPEVEKVCKALEVCFFFLFISLFFFGF